jgi:membrane protein DedA with SNARE-associated domain
MFETILEFMDGAGYAGIALLMFLENVFPPIPSELIVPSAGYSAGQGKLSIAGVILAATSGSVAGALFWYSVGKRIGDVRLKAWTARHGRWFTLGPCDVERVDRWFDAHSGKAVFFGRLVPAVRTLISVPAGIFGMGLPRFLLFSTLGTTVWTTLLAVAGYQLEGQHDKVEAWISPVANLVIGLMLAGYLYRVVTWRAA